MTNSCSDALLQKNLLLSLTKVETLSSQLRGVLSTKSAGVHDRDCSAGVLECAKGVVESLGECVEGLLNAKLRLDGKIGMKNEE